MNKSTLKSDFHSPFFIDEIRDQNAIFNNPRLIGIRKALKVYSKKLHNIKLNKKNEYEMGEYKHKLLSPPFKEFSKRFKEFRKVIGLTQKEMAFLVNTTQQSIYQIENANAVPSITWIINMIFYYDLNIHWFLTGEATMFTSRDVLEEKFTEINLENKKT